MKLKWREHIPLNWIAAEPKLNTENLFSSHLYYSCDDIAHVRRSLLARTAVCVYLLKCMLCVWFVRRERSATEMRPNNQLTLVTERPRRLHEEFKPACFYRLRTVHLLYRRVDVCVITPFSNLIQKNNAAIVFSALKKNGKTNYLGHKCHVNSKYRRKRLLKTSVWL